VRESCWVAMMIRVDPRRLEKSQNGIRGWVLVLHWLGCINYVSNRRTGHPAAS
jgi:hypothetical protein